MTRKAKRYENIPLLIDATFIALIAGITYYIRHSATPLSIQLSGILRFVPEYRPFAHFTDYAQIFVFYLPILLLLLKSYGLYEPTKWRRWRDEFVVISNSVTISILLVYAFLFLTKFHMASRWLILVNWGLAIVCLSGWRYMGCVATERKIKNGIYTTNVLIVGAGKIGVGLAETFKHNRSLGVNLVGFLDDKKGDDKIIGKIDDLLEVVQRQFIDDIYITVPSEREAVKRILIQAKKHRVNVHIVPELYDLYLTNPNIYMLGDVPVMEIRSKSRPAVQLAIKRVFDIFIASLILLFSLPLVLAIAMAIKLDSPGPVFYISKRSGQKGRVFDFYKFRSMAANADSMKEELRKHNERDGPIFKIKDDPRITGIGKFIRRYCLDELPQILNVIKGDMSIVGPRPHPLDDMDRYELEHLQRLDFMPGMTGLWQICGQDESFDEAMALDTEYIRNWSLWLDFKILFHTIPYVLSGKGK